MAETVKPEAIDDHVILITLNRPDRLNAMSFEFAGLDLRDFGTPEVREYMAAYSQRHRRERD